MGGHLEFSHGPSIGSLYVPVAQRLVICRLLKTKFKWPRSVGECTCMGGFLNCRFSQNVTKIQNTKLLILLVFYFDDE